MNQETGNFHEVDALGKLIRDGDGLKAGDFVPNNWLPIGELDIVTVTAASGQSAKFRVWKVEGGKVTLKPMVQK